VAFDSLLVFPEPLAFFPSLNTKQNPKSNARIQIYKKFKNKNKNNQRVRGKGVPFVS
jgi:hypothetical protein